MYYLNSFQPFYYIIQHFFPPVTLSAKFDNFVALYLQLKVVLQHYREQIVLTLDLQLRSYFLSYFKVFLGQVCAVSNT